MLPYHTIDDYCAFYEVYFFSIHGWRYASRLKSRGSPYVHLLWWGSLRTMEAAILVLIEWCPFDSGSGKLVQQSFLGTYSIDEDVQSAENIKQYLQPIVRAPATCLRLKSQDHRRWSHEQRTSARRILGRFFWIARLKSDVMPSLQPIVRVIWSLRLKSQTDCRQRSEGSRQVARSIWNS